MEFVVRPQGDPSPVASQRWSLSLKFSGIKLRSGPAFWLEVLPYVRPLLAGDVWTVESPFLSVLLVVFPFLSFQNTVFSLS